MAQDIITANPYRSPSLPRDSFTGKKGIAATGARDILTRPPASLLSLGAPDAALKGGLCLRELHELMPAAPFHCGAALGFALALAALAAKERGAVVFVQQDFAALEGGALYGAGSDLFGLPSARLLLVRAANPRDALFAMEEALKTQGVAAVIGELAEEGRAADLTATRRLSLAAGKREGLSLLVRQNIFPEPSAAATRWQIAAAPGGFDGFGGLGRTAFRLLLTKNRRGPCGSWVLEWDHHGKRFLSGSGGERSPLRRGEAALSLAVAAPACDRPGLARIAAAG